jgi:hypothetical protein
MKNLKRNINGRYHIEIDEETGNISLFDGNVYHAFHPDEALKIFDYLLQKKKILGEKSGITDINIKEMLKVTHLEKLKETEDQILLQLSMKMYYALLAIDYPDTRKIVENFDGRINGELFHRGYRWNRDTAMWQI